MQLHPTADSREPLWDQQHAVQHGEAARHAQEDQGPGQAGSRGLLGAAGHPHSHIPFIHPRIAYAHCVHHYAYTHAFCPVPSYKVEDCHGLCLKSCQVANQAAEPAATICRVAIWSC